MNIPDLQKEFEAGKPPKNLDGFYKGTLVKLVPGTLSEVIGSAFLHFWLPWRGKTFYYDKGRGDNVIPGYFAPFFRLRFGKPFHVSGGIFHAFPFKTSLQKSLSRDQTVFQLNYNLAENPANVRTVIDELVEVGKDTYLGKAYFVNKGTRLVAFFRLVK